MPRKTKNSQQARQGDSNTPRSYASVASPGSRSAETEMQHESNPNGQQENLTVDVEGAASSTVIEEQQPTIKIHSFSVEISDLHKFTKTLVEYKQETREKWVNFRTKLQSVVEKLASASRTKTWNPHSFKRILRFEETFSDETEDLLVSLFDDYIVEAPAGTTANLRNFSEPRHRFAKIFNMLAAAWSEENEEALATLARMKLQNLKYEGKMVSAFNQKFCEALTKQRDFNVQHLQSSTSKIT